MFIGTHAHKRCIFLARYTPGLHYSRHSRLRDSGIDSRSALRWLQHLSWPSYSFCCCLSSNYSILPGLLNNGITACSAFYPTPERSNVALFSDGYLRIPKIYLWYPSDRPSPTITSTTRIGRCFPILHFLTQHINCLLKIHIDLYLCVMYAKILIFKAPSNKSFKL